MKRDEAVLNAVVVEVEPTLFLPFASRDDASEAVVLLVLSVTGWSVFAGENWTGPVKWSGR